MCAFGLNLGACAKRNVPHRRRTAVWGLVVHGSVLCVRIGVPGWPPTLKCRFLAAQIANLLQTSLVITMWLFAQDVYRYAANIVITMIIIVRITKVLRRHYIVMWRISL